MEPRSRTALPGTNAIEIAPDVVLHTPNLPFIPSEEESDTLDAPSPGLHIDIDSQRRGVTPRDEKTCKETWVLCAALGIPLVISVWLFLLPVLIFDNTTSLSITPTQPVVSMTIDQSFTGVPDWCRDKITVEDVNGRVKVITPQGNDSGPKRFLTDLVFCMFNISRFSQFYDNPTQSTVAYTVHSLPLQFCHSVVYWSLGIENGQLKSRTPNLDQKVGLHQIRKVSRDRSIADLSVLVAIGGYAEDLPTFSKLQRDSTMMALFKDSIRLESSRFSLKGVTVDWVTAPPECHGTSDTADLNALLRAIRDAFSSSKQPDNIVSLMLGRSDVALAESVADVVDYFFIDTHKIQLPASSPVHQLCSSISTQVTQAMRPYGASGKIATEKLCTIESLAQLAAPGVRSPLGTFDIIPGKPLEREKFYHTCNERELCLDTEATNSCLVLRGPVTQNASGTFANLYIVSNEEAIKKRTSDLFRGTRFCTLMVDQDYDNFGGLCNRFRWYVLMRNLHDAIYGTKTTTRSIHTGTINCTP